MEGNASESSPTIRKGVWLPRKLDSDSDPYAGRLNRDLRNGHLRSHERAALALIIKRFGLC
jgi:hypothetical protein